MRLRVLSICLVLTFLTTACSSSANNASGATSKFDILQFFSGRQSNTITRTYRSDKEQATFVFEQIIKAIESNDSVALKELFSVSTVTSVDGFEEDMNALMDFYEGEMVSYKQFGPGTHAVKEGSIQRKEMFASFDIITTLADYRLAIRFFTVDSADPENLGVYSLYIIKAENSNPDSAYWGSDEWDAWNEGINIEKHTN